MKYLTSIFASLIFTWAQSALAGGVLEMSASQDSGEPGAVMEKIYAQDGRLRMDTLDGQGSVSTSMVFKDDELIQISHADRSFTRINQQTFEGILAGAGTANVNMAEASAQMAAATKQMEEQLASMPPEQRAMVQKMMGNALPGLGQLPGTNALAPEIRVEELGSDQWQSYRCTRYRVQLDADNYHELCAADAGQIEGGDEIRVAFDGMRAFHRRMMEALPQLPFGSPLAQLPAVMGEIEGFPVYRREYNQGNLLGERYLATAGQRALEDRVFEVPDGYQENPAGF